MYLVVKSYHGGNAYIAPCTSLSKCDIYNALDIDSHCEFEYIDAPDTLEENEVYTLYDTDDIPYDEFNPDDADLAKCDKVGIVWVTSSYVTVKDDHVV